MAKIKQSNSTETSAVDFIINQRLLPQLNLAFQKKYDLKHIDPFLKNIEELIPEQKSSLIHGDLWSGNYLYSRKEGFCLIDPAISYSLKNFDLAMMKTSVVHQKLLKVTMKFCQKREKKKII